MKQSTANMPSGTGQRARKREGTSKPAPLPTVGEPLDGSQFHNVIEEQKYSEQRPGREEQQPRRTDTDKTR